MTAHKHAEMIKAKADNMDLVVLCEGNGKWIEVTCSFGEIAWWEDKMYFLCLPKHKDAALHGLNGGSYQVKCLGDYSDSWYLNPEDWRGDGIWYMLESHDSRLKPLKQEKWIAYNHKNGNVYGTFDSEIEVIDVWPKLQRFKLEVEV